MTWWKSLGATLLTIVVAMGLAGLSQVPYSITDSNLSTLRLSWRIRPTNREQCRAPSPEELAGLPAHMRPTEICETPTIPYTLEVGIDGERSMEKSFTAAGARADRPIYVHEEIQVPAGTHAIDVRFFSDAALGDIAATDALPDLRFAGRLHMDSNRVALITYDESTGGLVFR